MNLDILVCAVGYFGMRTNGVMATCQPCPIGTWNHKLNQMEEAACNNCTGGKTTENNGTAAWTLCGESSARSVCRLLKE